VRLVSSGAWSISDSLVLFLCKCRCSFTLRDISLNSTQLNKFWCKNFYFGKSVINHLVHAGGMCWYQLTKSYCQVSKRKLGKRRLVGLKHLSSILLWKATSNDCKQARRNNQNSSTKSAERSSQELGIWYRHLEIKLPICLKICWQVFKFNHLIAARPVYKEWKFVFYA